MVDIFEFWVVEFESFLKFLFAEYLHLVDVVGQIVLNIGNTIFPYIVVQVRLKLTDFLINQPLLTPITIFKWQVQSIQFIKFFLIEVNGR